MIRIVLIDDHALMRTGLRLILDKQLDMEVVAEADDGEPGLAQIRKHAPDVALVDLHMPGVSGIEVTERVPHSFPDNAHNRDYLRVKAEKGGHLL